MNAPPQAENIVPDSTRMPINVSGPMLRQMFHACTPDHITSVCHGRCCQGSGGIMVTVHPSERTAIEALGAEVKDGFILPDARGLCPFKDDAGTCRIHGDAKPFGCKASPFTLNKTDTLIVRNRYRMLRCYKCDGAAPAYLAHSWSLVAVLGKHEANRVAALAATGAHRIPATIGAREYAMLRDNDDAKHGVAHAEKLELPYPKRALDRETPPQEGDGGANPTRPLQ